MTRPGSGSSMLIAPSLQQEDRKLASMLPFSILIASLSVSAPTAAASTAPLVSPEPALAVAETDSSWGVGAGDWLLTLEGLYASENNEFAADTDSFSLSTEVSYFFTDEHEVGLGVDFLFFDVGAFDGLSLAAGPFYNFNFRPAPRTNLYVGVEAAIGSFDDGTNDDTAFTYGVHVGGRWWVTDRASITMEPRFRHTEFDDSFGGQQDRFDIFVGLSIGF